MLKRVLASSTPPSRNAGDLTGVDLRIEPGTILGLLGPEGAGKSTLLRILAGLLRASSGTAHIDGLDPWKNRKSLQRRTGYLVLSSRSWHRELSVFDNLLFFAKIAGLASHEAEPQISQVLEKTHLSHLAQEPMYRQGPGTLQKLAVARLLLKNPSLIIMDEATRGLDPLHRSEFYGLLLEHVQEHKSTVLYATHDLNEAQFLCNRVALMNEGRIVAEGRYLDVQDTAATLFEPSLNSDEDTLARARRLRRNLW